jgi:phage terminase small subunit
MVVREIAKVAFHDIRKLYDEEGRLLPISELDEETAQVISSFKQNSKFDRNGELEGYVEEYKRHDKMKALELLGKHLGIYEADNKQKNQNITVSLSDSDAEI